MNDLQIAIDAFTTRNAYPAFTPKAVFFDMDGVLFNSMPAHARAWVAAMAEVGVSMSTYDVYMNEGRTGSSTIDNTFVPQKGRQATEEEKQFIYRRKSELFDAQGEPEAIPHIHEVLAYVHQRQWQAYVVTGSAHPELYERLNRNFSGIFDPRRMVTAYDVKIGKPHPEPYLMALQKSGLQPYEVMVVENAPLGVQSGVAAGLFTMAVNTGILQPEELQKAGADYLLPDMQHLLECMQQLP